MSMSMSVFALPIYVINMQRRPDRWAEVQRQLLSAGFHPTNIHRHEAVDGTRLSKSEIAKCTTRKARESLKRPREAHEELGSVGAIGCYLSHVGVWQQIVRTRRPSLVAEDDLVIRRDQLGVLRALNMDNIPFDSVLLGYVSIVPLPPSSTSQGVVTYRNAFYGTQLYWLSPQGAERLLEHAFPIEKQVDAFMGDCFVRNKVRGAVHVPPLAAQRCIDTDIQTNPVKMLHPTPQGLSRVTRIWIVCLMWLVIVTVVSMCICVSRCTNTKISNPRPVEVVLDL